MSTKIFGPQRGPSSVRIIEAEVRLASADLISGDIEMSVDEMISVVQEMRRRFDEIEAGVAKSMQEIVCSTCGRRARCRRGRLAVCSHLLDEIRSMSTSNSSLPNGSMPPLSAVRLVLHEHEHDLHTNARTSP